MGPRTLNMYPDFTWKREHNSQILFSSILESSVLTHKYFSKELNLSDLNNYESVHL